MISGMVASLLLVGCGDDTTSKVDTTSNLTEETGSAPVVSKKIGRGYYVDAAVSGVHYNCGDEEGLTDELGTFTFSEDSNCTFKIGDLVLREVNSSILEDNITVFEDNQSVAKLLQTLDADNNASNGIQLLPETHEVLREQEVREVPKNETELTDIKEGLKDKKPNEYRGEVVSDDDVNRHLEETRTRLSDENRTTQYDVEINETHSSEDRNSTSREMQNEEEHSNRAENSTNRDENSTSREISTEETHENRETNATNREMQNEEEHLNRDENSTSSEMPSEEEREERREEQSSRR